MKKASDLAESASSVSAVGALPAEMPWDDETSVLSQYQNKIYIKHLYGPLFFGATTSFQEMIKGLDPNIRVLILRMDRVPHIDQSGLYTLEEAIMDLLTKDVIVLMTGTQSQPLDMMKRIDIVPGVITESQMFDDFQSCEVWLRDHLEGDKGGLETVLKELHEVKKAKVAYRM